MKVLIVSFDRTLTEDIKEALRDHEVLIAKNSEEALKTIPSDVDVVVYDAISGAISEEDINNLYTKKFSSARYVILYDELFPIDENNIKVENKVLVKRDEAPQKIASVILEGTEASIVESVSDEIIIETPYLDEGGIKKEEEETEKVQEEETKEEKEKETSEKILGKILIVSFDQNLVNSIKSAVGDKFEIEVVRTVKSAIEKGKDAGLIIFDAISGMIAEKGLIDMSNNPDVADKPYIILVDDLFPINVDAVPIRNKKAISRDTDPSKIAELVEENFTVVQEERKEEVSEETVEETKTVEVREEQEAKEEEPQEDIEIPALSALERIIEGEKKEEEQKEEVPETVSEEVVNAPSYALEEKETTKELNVEEALRTAVFSALSEDRIKSIVSQAIGEKLGDISSEVAQIVSRSVNETLSQLVSQKVEEAIKKAIEEVDVKSIIKEVAYQLLKEKINELVS